MLIFFLWYIIFGIAVAQNVHFLFWFLEELSYSDNTCSAWIKTLQGISILAQTVGGEMPMYFSSGWILSKTGHIHSMSISLFGQGLVMLAISYLRNPWWILGIMPFQGAIFGLHYATAATYTHFVAPNAQATMQVKFFFYTKI